MKKIMFCFIIASLIISGCSQNVVKRENQPDIYLVENENKEMNQAIQKTKENLSIFIKELSKNNNEYTNLLLKARFEEGEKIEHMWVSDITYSSSTFMGILSNEPMYVKNLSYGDIVFVNKNQVSDWMIVKEDGTVIGGYTLRVLRNRMTQKEREEFDKSTGYKFE
ncbi:hypothetical protein U472_09965 [Orenia metallireducens]|uniref:DUF2314 domain-containing protein n=1 Tax=Orenia metallireducens TaxID=1413210 RepID=A0A1C0A7T8_9FIRM|nr:DUF2314 domain-containing protein [Orenia metallireducens]OCL26325.1 hypothetical protein U472_09965 [Orenia metallireducens]